MYIRIKGTSNSIRFNYYKIKSKIKKAHAAACSIDQVLYSLKKAVLNRSLSKLYLDLIWEICAYDCSLENIADDQ
ncbi:hypothetical protein TRIP_B40477 [uncultured Desulfatiglans sp.]|nr:hypothetical protein TRIP_B40477 [uncultured Desulfatiglans sp.]